ncbi:MAG TPA: hypothetical protein VG897_02705 [Terriglobales bacterium]|nr:hypothetical protein [Terriglobales bacterium]
MARLARLSAGVIFGIHLRERGWLGEIRLVAARTENGRIRKLRFYVHWIRGVIGLRTMAGFAMNPRVFAGLFSFDNVAVAVFTDFLAGKLDRLMGNFRQGIATVVSVLSEALRHECGAKDKKDGQSGEKDGR